MLFKILLVIDLITLGVVLYFFFIGLNDGTVVKRNAALWSRILFSIAFVIGGGILLRQQLPYLSAALLATLAIPALGYLAFMLISMCWKGRWN